jgi:16S rRNA (cytosine967-C5)-methyltransferase
MKPKRGVNSSNGGERKSSLNLGRKLAGGVLKATESGYHADSEMDRRGNGVSTPDRALAWNIVQGVLRKRGSLDRHLAEAAGKSSISKFDVEVRVALRIGLFEILEARTPNHAAVDQAVQLVAVLGRGRARGVVNAVLRKAISHRFEADVFDNHPKWLVKRWRGAHGESGAEKMCRANDKLAPLGISIMPDNAAVVEQLREAVEWIEPATVSGEPLNDAWVLGGVRGAVSDLPGFGSWWVMDPAAVAAVDMLQLQPGERVLDVCAAPGGKTMRIASQGAVAHATDRSQGRLLRLKESAQRLGFDVAVSQVDWILKPEIDGPDMDAVLVDAPCTGLGTLRRHPEIRWRTMPTDPAAMALEQLEILTNASKRVRVGGRVVYSVCSPEPEEGAELVAQFLIENPNFTVEADILSAPQRFHEDAFYGARIRRNS